MTSDEIKKVREAADIVLGRFGCHRADCRDCAKFVFSLVGTDGEEPVTEEWLRDEWGFEDTGRHSVVYNFGKIDILWRNIPMSFISPFECVTTRYQFRLLAAALGIKRKEKS